MTSTPMTPEVAALIRATGAYKAAEGARKRTYYTGVFRGPMTIASFWDGGSKSVYTVMRLADRQCITLPSNHPLFEPGRPYTMVGLPAGHVLIETGCFCGKTAHVYIYTSPHAAADLRLAPNTTTVAVEESV